MADRAPPDAHNRESSSNSLKSSALWWVSWLVTPVMSKPVAAHHAFGQRHAAVGALVFAKTLLQNVLHKLAVEPVICEL